MDWWKVVAKVFHFHDNTQYFSLDLNSWKCTSSYSRFHHQWNASRGAISRFDLIKRNGTKKNWRNFYYIIIYYFFRVFHIFPILSGYCFYYCFAIISMPRRIILSSPTKCRQCYPRDRWNMKDTTLPQLALTSVKRTWKQENRKKNYLWSLEEATEQRQ